MAVTAPTTDTTLILKRTFHAPRERVFEAWTKPDLLTQWFGPTDDFNVKVEDMKLVAGGSYKINMGKPDPKMNVIYGKYREIVKPERLVFTWNWEGEPGETIVTVTFKEEGTSTEVVLKQEYFANADERDNHNRGWSGCMSRLERLFPV
jgi:uncharacterized protein YndB with AHSA1/START domain